MASPVGSPVAAVDGPAEVSVSSAIADLNAAIEEAVGHHRSAVAARGAGYDDLAGTCVEQRNRSAREAFDLARGIIATRPGNLGVESLVYQAMSPAEHGCIEWHRWA